MKTIQVRFVRFLRKLRGRVPMALPTGSQEFTRFCDWIIKTYDVPDYPSYREMIAQIIMHLPENLTAVSPRHFAVRIQKGMSNEVAYQCMMESRKRKNPAPIPIESAATVDAVAPSGEIPSLA